MPKYDYFRVTKYVTYYEIARRWYLALEKNGHDCWIEEKQTGGEWAVWRRGEGAGFSDNKERCQGGSWLSRGRGRRKEEESKHVSM